MKCRYFCRLPLDISPVYLTRGISQPRKSVDEVFERSERKEPEVFAALATTAHSR